MFISPHERLGVFIDGPYLLSACHHFGFKIDFKRLLDLFRAQGHLVRASFYQTTAGDGDANSLRPLLDWLEYNGYATCVKAAKAHPTGGARPAAGIELDLAIDAMCFSGSVDHLIIFSGAEDFTKLVLALKGLRKRVTVVAARAPQVSVADELRRAADQFVDVSDLKDKICCLSSLRHD